MTEQLIQVLSEKDKARKKINVWHGSSQRWIKMTHELIGNSLDIFSNDEINEIKIIIHNKNKIEFMDSASGIPLEKTASNGQPNYEAIFETSFAGSKYSASQNVGTNGVYLWTLTATCEDIEYYIARPDGNIYNIAYHKGDRTKELNIIGKSEITYSRMIFSLDEEVWDKPNFTFEEISKIAQAQSSLANVKITVEDKENNKYKEFYYENGIEDYFEELTIDKTMVGDNIRITKDLDFFVEKNKATDNISVDLLFNYSNDSEDDIQRDFLNTADLVQHGTIQEGIILGLKNSIHKWLKDNGKYNKNEKAINLEDTSTGLNYISNIKSCYVEFVSQVKEQCLNPHHKIVLKNVVEDYMNIFFIENKEQSEKICNQVLLNSRIRTKSDIARKDAKKQLEEKADSIATRPNKFVPCRSKIISEIIYIVIEGDGAMNSIKLARNPKTMCIQPLKGKPINPFKCKLDDLLSNDEVLAMYKVWNCGIEYNGKPVKGMPKYNYDNLQVNDIIAYTDFDWDGWHIQCLLIGILYRLSPDLLKRGKFYIGITPLYVVRTQKEVLWKDEKTKELLAYSENEYSEMVKYLNKNNIKFKETRFKGLGGLPVNIMARSLNPETRILKQITMDDVEKSKELLELFLSDDDGNQQKRKEFIELHSKEYFDYSLFTD